MNHAQLSVCGPSKDTIETQWHHKGIWKVTAGPIPAEWFSPLPLCVLEGKFMVRRWKLPFNGKGLL
jgi:hypothetical protein